jgi:DNA polymerase III subunit epsilon
MLEIILDTETTGLSIAENHRIVEIGCLELENLIPTNNVFHEYLNPQREVSKEAFKVHGYTEKFLSDKKNFSEIVDEFLNFIKDKKIIIHNASFDLAFLNHELRLTNQKALNKDNVVDTLEIARQKHPGAQNSLDALCKRYNIDNSKREKHSAIVDCQLLKEVYVNLLDQKEPKLNLESPNIFNLNLKKNTAVKINNKRKIIKPNPAEVDLHKKYLKLSLQKNNYN